MYFILRNLVSQFDENINVKVPSKRQYYGILRMAAKEITIFASEKIYSIFDAILKLLKWKYMYYIHSFIDTIMLGKWEFRFETRNLSKSEL